jgi:hypothetical protein
MLGYRNASREGRTLASALQRFSRQIDDELPIVVVSGLSDAATVREADELQLALPLYLDDTADPILDRIGCCRNAFVAAIRNDDVIAIACAEYTHDLAHVVQIALLEAGISHIDVSRALDEGEPRFDRWEARRFYAA